MNWVGGARSRLKKKNAKRTQQQYFEEKRKIIKYGTGISIPPTPKTNGFAISQDLLSLQTVAKAHDGKEYIKSRDNTKNPFFHNETPFTKKIGERQTLVTSSTRDAISKRVNQDTVKRLAEKINFQPQANIRTEVKQATKFNDNSSQSHANFSTGIVIKPEEIKHTKNENFKKSIYFNLYGGMDVFNSTISNNPSSRVDVQFNTNNEGYETNTYAKPREETSMNEISLPSTRPQWYNLDTSRKENEIFSMYSKMESSESPEKYLPYSTPGPHSKVTFEVVNREEKGYDHGTNNQNSISPEEMMDKVDELLDDKSSKSSIHSDRSDEESLKEYAGISETFAGSFFDTTIIGEYIKESKKHSAISETTIPQHNPVQSIDRVPVQNSLENNAEVCKVARKASASTVDSSNSLGNEVLKSLTLIKEFQQIIYEEHLYLKACLIVRMANNEDNTQENSLAEDEEKISLNVSEE